MNLPAPMRSCLRLALAFAVALPLLSGCAAAPRLFVNRDADMTMYKKVAIAPFTNLSGEAFASNRVVRAFTTELIISKRLSVVDPSMYQAELERLNAQMDSQGAIDITKLREACGKLEATAVIRGAVSEYGLRRNGTEEFPVVSFDAEMVDVQTGIVIWRISVTESGKGRLPIVGGVGERTFSRVTEHACRRAVDLLKAKVL
ncbi:MAG: hypothetical protein HZA61_06295 [Candidatus Eisenbacteria bacterium]|uniref:DUF4410 domain-containing protein n=1 Tax=Eiseniibacteriota bacterium TaxID=2212470 RepID=A0A933W2P5_UNCEI|nr:hypothetical protein [Candidatus Eisenbacteria bacterium]